MQYLHKRAIGLMVVCVLILAIGLVLYWWNRSSSSPSVNHIQIPEVATSTKNQNQVGATAPVSSSEEVATSTNKQSQVPASEPALPSPDKAPLSLTFDKTDLSLAHVSVHDPILNITTVFDVPYTDEGLAYMMRYQRGNLYVITCSDCHRQVMNDSDMTTIWGPNWNRQLKVFSTANPEGVTLMEDKGLGNFAVTDDGSYIGIEDSHDGGESSGVLILDAQGKRISEYSNVDLGSERWSEPQYWKGHVLYVASSDIGRKGTLSAIDIDSQKISTF